MPANDYIITGEKEEYLKEFKEQARILEEKITVIEAIGIEESDRKIIEEVKTGIEGIKRRGMPYLTSKSPQAIPRRPSSWRRWTTNTPRRPRKRPDF